MNNDNVIAFQSSETATPFSDALSELVRRSGIKFNSSLLPLYLKRSQSVEEVLP